MKKLFSAFFAALFFSSSLAFAAIGDWKTNETSQTKTRVLGSFYADKTGEKKLIIGVEFKLTDGWKIYGQGSEGIGVPPSFNFAGSENYLKHEITWPKAEEHEEKIGDQTFKYFAYHDSVILPIAVDVNDKDADSKISLKLNYGVCKDICVPVEEELSLKIDREQDQKSLELIQKFYPHEIFSEAQGTETPEQSSDASIFYWIIIGIIGGAILNIMPCVLPILSIKLLSIVNHIDADIRRIRFAFFATCCGIILCFLVFAVCAILIKLAGNSFGWGLQFQNPYFLIFLIIVLIFFVANLLGIFELTFNQLLVNLLNKKIDSSNNKKNIFIPNFLSGILAVLLATPCSAPILGSAISFALTRELFEIIIIFLAIGLGFALPYLVLIIVPKTVYLLPKPGKWMLHVKRLMALFLALTVLWLGLVLSGNIGVIPAITVVISCLLLLICLEMKTKFFKFLAINALIAISFSMPYYATQKNFAQNNQSQVGTWIEFDEMLLYKLVRSGGVVVVDVTADWCITCKINKITVLNNKEIIDKLYNNNVITMRADITKPNAEVMQFLAKHNRFAIPFNAVYGPNAKNGLLTSELLTKKELFELIDKAK